MAQERYIAVYPPALKLPAGGNPATHALEQGMAAWSQQLQQWLSQEVSKILGQATDHGQQINAHGQQIDALENVGKIKARAYRKAAQSIDADSTTKVLIDTIDRDTEGVVDTTNSRIIPNLPGDYVVMGSVCAFSAPSDLRINAMIFKNGVPASDGASGFQDEVGFVSSSTSDLIYMNGTDDYLELWVQNNSLSASALAYSIEPTGYPINYISIVGPF